MKSGFKLERLFWGDDEAATFGTKDWEKVLGLDVVKGGTSLVGGCVFVFV